MNQFCPLASGSKGNLLYLGTDETKILIDAGLSRKQTLEKLAEIGVSIEEIDAILVTHDHTDHIHGIRLLASKYQIPVLANVETAKGIVEQSKTKLPFKIFTTGEPFSFGSLEIDPFSIQHDTMDPVGFIIKTEQKKIAIAADVGMVTTSLINKLKGCDILYVEANHEPEWVHASPRPASYKQRVLSRTGHLSNKECGFLLTEIAHGDIDQVYLAHLSSECNSPEKALEMVSETLQQNNISLPLTIAHQHKISPIKNFD